MKKQLLAAAVCVSSVVTGLASASADELRQWNGLYGGVHAGISHSGSSDVTGTAGPLSLSSSFEHDTAILGGAQIGYNFQNDRYVFGLEADFSGTDLSSDSGELVNLFNFVRIGTFTSEVDWFGTVRARAGVLLDDDFLVYGTGGLAYGHVTNSIGYSIGFCPRCISDSASGSEVRLGYTVGAGVESNVNDSVKVKLEYLYVDLGSGQFFEDRLGRFDVSADSDVNFHVARIGVNIDFDTPVFGQ